MSEECQRSDPQYVELIAGQKKHNIMGTHIHLDLVGGLSGDMFIGAMLDIFWRR